MICFPQSVFTSILKYADDRIERNQRSGLKECLKTISRLRNGWYYTHVLYMQEYGINYDFGEDNTNEENIDYHIQDVINFHKMISFEHWDEVNNDRMYAFQDRINGGVFIPPFN
jgi:hypothetical protein